MGFTDGSSAASHDFECDGRSEQTTYNAEHATASPSLSWPFDFCWASAPSLITDPDEYFTHEAMLCVDDFQYPSWQEFDCKLKKFEMTEANRRQQQKDLDDLGGEREENEVEEEEETLEEHGSENAEEQGLDYRELTARLLTPPLCPPSPCISADDSTTGNSSELLVSSSSCRKRKMTTKKGNRTIRIKRDVPLTSQSLITTLQAEQQPFTLKRNIYMEWIKPQLVENPPLQRENVSICEAIHCIPDLLSTSEDNALKALRHDIKARSNGFDFETLLASITNKTLLLHFYLSGSFHLNRVTRKALLEALGELVFGTIVNELYPQHALMARLLEHRIKYFRDVMSRQFKQPRLSKGTSLMMMV